MTWIVPTARTVGSSLLVITLVATVLALAGVVAGTQDVTLPAVHVWLLGAALAGAVAAPHDPLGDLVAATPTGPGRRVVHRVTITLLTGLVAWLLAGRIVAAAGRPLDAAVDVPALVALASIAVAAVRWFGPRGACAPLALVTLAQVVDGSDAARVLDVWRTDPWPVVVGGVAATVVQVRRAG